MKVSNNDTQAEETKKEALEYLNANYSDTFTAKVYTSSNWAYEYESIIFTSEKYPEGVVEVLVYENEDGTHRFEDNYYQCYMMDDAIDYGKSFVSGQDAVVKVRFMEYVWSDKLCGAQSFKEWKSQGTARAEFFIITGNPLTTDVQEEIVNKVATDKVSGTIVFVVTNDRNLLQDITLDEILNNQNEYIVSKNEYYIDYNFEIETN